MLSIAYIIKFMRSKKYEGKITIMEKDKCDELKFYQLDKLPNNMIPYVKKGIEYYNELQKINYSVEFLIKICFNIINSKN